jgi:hypothetical protein
MPRVLSPSQRRKLARNMKVRKLRIKRRKDIVEKKPPSKERVARLAARKALKVLKHLRKNVWLDLQQEKHSKF